ncbi:hypothetical protein GOBAR_DD08065 [Gossypium barbadense]|nr:hypothetical protein GOBAR_DD08065 [Gossypium barbadense]
MKPFMNMFMASQGAEDIQWPDQLSDSSMDDKDEEEEVNEIEGEKGDAADDEETEDNDATPYVDITEDALTFAPPTTEASYPERLPNIHEL